MATHTDPNLHRSNQTVLLVGATGTFGERLAEGLIRSGISVIGVARDRNRLEALARRLGPLFAVDARDKTKIDVIFLRGLRSKHPGLYAVADASGPFQTSDLLLPEAAIGAGMHYVDLADGRVFVARIAQLDHAARTARVAVIAGASSTPALSHAVLDSLIAGSRKVIAIDVSIAPGNRAPRGLSVMRAILSTVGQPLRVFRGCRWTDERGWGLNKTIELPSVGRRRVALCETPDLDLLVERYHPVADAMFRAGLELRLLHESTRVLGLLVRSGTIASLAPYAGVLRFIADMFRPFGSDRGGMSVDALVANETGQLVRRRWTITAESGVGPYIPTLPALAALKMLAEGTMTWRGAAPCAGLIPYQMIAAEFAHHDLATQTEETSYPPPLFHRLLGPDYDILPESVRKAHCVEGVLVLEGKADAAGPDHFLGRLIARLFRLPKPGVDMPIRVEMRDEGDGSETWTRFYPDVTMRSNLRNADPATRQIDECFGPVSIRLQWNATAQGLSLHTLNARLLGIPLPNILCPRSKASESIDADGVFRFDVAIALPVIGPLVHYRGWLRPHAPS